jgi:hypothetical protein
MRSSTTAQTLLLTLLMPFMVLCGCMSAQPSGNLTVSSRAENPVKMPLELKYGAFAKEPAQHSFFLSSVPLEDLQDKELLNGIVLHAQLLWQPKPGSTPVDPTATNVTLRLLLVTDGEVGLYGGAGFAWPSGDLDDGPASLEIVGSSMTLLDSTDGFRDLLSPVLLLGYTQAPLNSVEALRFRQAASQLVTDKLGTTRWVRQDSWISPGVRAALPCHREIQSTQDQDQLQLEPDQS